MKGPTVRDLPALSEALAAFFRTRTEVAAACIFGSVARGEPGPLSDLDIAVLLDPVTFLGVSSLEYRASLLTDLMQLVKSNDVDLVLLNEAGPFLAHRVLRDARFVHIADHRALTEFRFRALQRYLDTKPLRRVQEVALAERIATGRFGRGGEDRGR